MRNKLSNDPTVLVLGVISIVIVFLGCCCGLFAAVSLASGIAGIVLANKSLRQYDLAPENYLPQSRSNVYIGKVLSIIGTALSAVYVVVIIVVYLFFGTIFSQELLKDLYNKRNKNTITQETVIQDTLKNLGESYEFEKDTLYIDTVKTDAIEKK